MMTSYASHAPHTLYRHITFKVHHVCTNIKVKLIVLMIPEPLKGIIAPLREHHGLTHFSSHTHMFY